MALPRNAANVLIAAGYEVLQDFACVEQLGSTYLEWYFAGQQPTEQQLNDWASDVTPLPNGQLFSQWLAENGGDPLLTLRRKAKEFQDEQQAQNVALRVTVKLLVDELNILRKWVTDLKAATAASTNYATLKSGIAALPNVPQRTYQQAKTAINTLIDSEA